MSRVDYLATFLEIWETRLLKSWRPVYTRIALHLTPHQVYYSGNQINTVEMGGAYRTYEEEEWCIQVFGGKTLGKEPLGNTRRKREYNISTDLQ